MKMLIAATLLVGACADSDDARLDRAQILAVRAEPANVAPGEIAQIRVLAGDAAGEVFELDPDGVDAGELVVEHRDGGWFVTAGGTPGIATLAITATIDGASWPATKALVVNAHADNPAVAMTIDGTIATEMLAHVGESPTLTAMPTGREPFTFAWYSSIGDLTDYRQTTATLAVEQRGEGTLVLVVRDSAGGASWEILPASVQ
jgi:hypothetical protein